LNVFNQGFPSAIFPMRTVEPEDDTPNFSVLVDLTRLCLNSSGMVVHRRRPALRKLKSLQVEFAELLTSKKEAYAELKKVRDELKELSVHKANYEELRDLQKREERKEKEHGRE
jgi:predicted nuclease with TOPRIM domain